MREILSVDAALLIGPDSKELIGMLEERHNKTAYCPYVVGTGIVGSLVTAGLASEGNYWWWVACGFSSILALLGGWYTRQRDLDRKTVEIDYNMHEDEVKLWNNLKSALSSLAACQLKWQRTAEGDVRDRKRNAGATTVIERNRISIGPGLPPYFKSNIHFVVMQLKYQTMYWGPRYILVYRAHRVGMIPYRNLRVFLNTTRFIENEGVPADARVVDTTWKYVNKSGAPDRRFANNSEIPVCEYGEITLKTPSGFHVELMTSQTESAQALPIALEALVQHRESVDKHVCHDERPQPQIVAFNCHACGARFRVSTKLQGKHAKCKACGARLTVPRPQKVDV